MSTGFLYDCASKFIPDFADLLEAAENKPGWQDFLVANLAVAGIGVSIRNRKGWQHVSDDKPWQLDFPVEDEEFDSYIVEFFESEDAALDFARRNGLRVAKPAETS